ncbi:PLDc N-terminal domain-containing protein [Methanosarcina sp. UBA289]|uniref:PLDc N-terminal domain-containing protein n=1 Tax=Methanosarcina sp. UBA289 TaxID=1915574 RepID=UPI0025F37121|nr:PLDc N-terminal domain-containing protein [Methanosarcina sp. UBA289]
MIGFSYVFILSAFIGLLSFVFWVWTLIDCVKKETDIGNTRLIWVIIIVLTYIIGAFLYYLIRRPKRHLELGK